MSLSLNDYSPAGLLETSDPTPRQLVGFVPMLGSRGAVVATIVGMAQSGAVGSWQLSLLWARDVHGLTHTSATQTVRAHSTTDALGWVVTLERHEDAIVVNVAGSPEVTLWSGRIEATEAV